MSSDSNTKYLILVPDGMADTADAEQTTALQSANTPWMDKLAACGRLGLARTIPQDMSPGSDVANLAILGYNPKDAYTGRAPLEAASMGVNLKNDDLAFRVNFVTLDRNYTEMADHSADHITTQEAHELAKYLAPDMEAMGFTLYPGVSYRSLLVWKRGLEGCRTTAPHDFPGEPIADKLPSGPGADHLLRLIIKSWRALEDHPVNRRRIKRCLRPANSIWPWGQGKPPRIRTITERFGLTGSVIAAVDLVRGLGKYAGLRIVDVPGATGYMDTNYAGKAQAAIDQLRNTDLVYVHVEAPDEAGHSGQMDLKVKAIEDYDEKILGPILAGLAQFPKWRILLMPDHCTPVQSRTHTAEPVPYLIVDSHDWKTDITPEVKFSEAAAKSARPEVLEGAQMIEELLGRTEHGAE